MEMTVIMIRTLERIIEGQGNVPQGAEALGLVHSKEIITEKAVVLESKKM